VGKIPRGIVALRAAHVAKEQRVAYPLLRLLPFLEKDPGRQRVGVMTPHL
jgi:hypothetical protein